MHWLQCCGNAEGWGGLTLGFAEDGVMEGCVCEILLGRERGWDDCGVAMWSGAGS